MSASAATQELSQPLAHRAYSFDDERDDQASDEESAPLLDVQSDQPARAIKESPSTIKATHILTSLTLIFSVLAVMLLIANKILTEAQEYAHYTEYEFYWPTRAGSRAVGITVCGLCLRCTLPRTFIETLSGGVLYHHINIKSSLHSIRTIRSAIHYQPAFRCIGRLPSDRLCHSRPFYHWRHVLFWIVTD